VIQDEDHGRLLLARELLQEEASETPEEVPVHEAQVVPRRVGAMVGELVPAAATVRPRRSGTLPAAGGEGESFDLPEERIVEQWAAHSSSR
jgi:hypothetical protein